MSLPCCCVGPPPTRRCSASWCWSARQCELCLFLGVVCVKLCVILGPDPVSHVEVFALVGVLSSFSANTAAWPFTLRVRPLVWLRVTVCRRASSGVCVVLLLACVPAVSVGHI